MQSSSCSSPTRSDHRLSLPRRIRMGTSSLRLSTCSSPSRSPLSPTQPPFWMRNGESHRSLPESGYGPAESIDRAYAIYDYSDNNNCSDSSVCSSSNDSGIDEAGIDELYLNALKNGAVKTLPPTNSTTTATTPTRSTHTLQRPLLDRSSLDLDLVLPTSTPLPSHLSTPPTPLHIYEQIDYASMNYTDQPPPVPKRQTPRRSADARTIM